MSFKKAIIISFLIHCLWSCNQPETNIVHLPKSTYIKYEDSSNKQLVTVQKDFYVVTNAPEEIKDQWNIIWDYCCLPQDTLDRNVNKLFKNFYHETAETPVDFEENRTDYFEIDRIENHDKDLFLRIELRHGNPYECIFMKDGEIILISKICEDQPCEFIKNHRK